MNQKLLISFLVLCQESPARTVHRIMLNLRTICSYHFIYYLGLPYPALYIVELLTLELLSNILDLVSADVRLGWGGSITIHHQQSSKYVVKLWLFKSSFNRMLIVKNNMQISCFPSWHFCILFNIVFFLWKHQPLSHLLNFLPNPRLGWGREIKTLELFKT